MATPARVDAPLSPDLLRRMDAYWRAANYLSVGQIYLRANPLLDVPLRIEDVKPRLLGLLREYAPHLRVRVVNVVDLMALQPPSEHPHGLSDAAFDAMFTVDKPVIFAFHGYPALIHKLAHRRRNHGNFHVRGWNEEGTTTTPFDMVVLNNLDRYQLALDAILRSPQCHAGWDAARARHLATMNRHRRHVSEHGDDMPEVKDWRWTPRVEVH